MDRPTVNSMPSSEIKKAFDFIADCADDARDKFANVISCPSPLNEFLAIQKGLLSEYGGSSADLGDFRCFPSEIMLQVCASLDIASLLAFSRVNRRAGQIARSLRDYSPVITHALIAIHALLRTGVASHFTISQLREVLHEENCSICGWFGGFLFLPTLRRCCYRCINSSKELSVVPMETLEKWSEAYSIRPRELPIPILLSARGEYRGVPFYKEQQVELVAAESIQAAAPKMNQMYGVAGLAPHIYRFMATTKLPFLDPVTLQRQSGVGCEGCLASYDDFELNYLLQDIGSAGDGLQVNPEFKGMTNSEIENVLYSEAGFVGHYRRCWKAQYFLKGLYPDRDVTI